MFTGFQSTQEPSYKVIRNFDILQVHILMKKTKTKDKLKVKYEYVKTAESEAKLEKAFDFIFEEVLKKHDR